MPVKARFVACVLRQESSQTPNGERQKYLEESCVARSAQLAMLADFAVDNHSYNLACKQQQRGLTHVKHRYSPSMEG